MSCFAVVVGDGPVRRVTPEAAASYSGSGFTWTHVESADGDVATTLRDQDIPEIAANALVATETRPRCDSIGDGALINLRGLAHVDPQDSDRLVSVRFWVRAGQVNSVSRRTLAATVEVVAQVDAGTIRDPGDLIAGFAKSISAQLDPQVADLGDTLDECESGLEPRQAYKLRARIANIRSEAIALRRFVAPDRDALTTLAQLPFEWLADDDRLHIREAADRFARMTEELEAVRERSALIHEQLTDLRGELMETRSLLISIVALIFLPLTFITGLFGMNVGGIPLKDDPWAFWQITALCVAISAAIAIYFARIQWLKASAAAERADGRPAADQASNSTSQYR